MIQGVGGKGAGQDCDQRSQKEEKRRKRENMDRQRRGKDESGQIGEETHGKRVHFLRSPLARGHGAMGQTAASLPSTEVPVWSNWLLLAQTLKL